MNPSTVTSNATDPVYFAENQAAELDRLRRENALPRPHDTLNAMEAKLVSEFGRGGRFEIWQGENRYLCSFYPWCRGAYMGMGDSIAEAVKDCLERTR